MPAYLVRSVRLMRAPTPCYSYDLTCPAYWTPLGHEARVECRPRGSNNQSTGRAEKISQDFGSLLLTADTIVGRRGFVLTWRPEFEGRRETSSFPRQESARWNVLIRNTARLRNLNGSPQGRIIRCRLPLRYPGEAVTGPLPVFNCYALTIDSYINMRPIPE